ncbi:hypothetical protein FQN49_008697, partial [Arthroderma sp. PD_2]
MLYLIRYLQGRSITKALLDELQKPQADSWPPHIGYLSYITDDRNPGYWRPYVGQSNDPRRRIGEHIKAIQT